MRRLVVNAGKHFLRALGEFQARHSLVATTPFLPREQFPWADQFEAEWRKVRDELDGVLTRPQDIPAFHQLSPDQARISKGDNWKTYPFYVFGKRLDDNCAVCPQTTALLEGLPGLQNAWFSILAPRYHIPPHKGPTRGVVRVHLALRVPEDREACWIRVDDERYAWREGEIVMFDDTYEHEVRNDTDDRRAVLFIDVERPMDRLGGFVNRALLALVRSSTYVSKPLANLREWNRKHPPGGEARS
ncbi:MAG: aspartyl/asparaginyl beta-hydroxylase domain-containing protein [Pseudomonadota bacterium]